VSVAFFWGSGGIDGVFVVWRIGEGVGSVRSGVGRDIVVGAIACCWGFGFVGGGVEVGRAMFVCGLIEVDAGFSWDMRRAGRVIGLGGSFCTGSRFFGGDGVGLILEGSDPLSSEVWGSGINDILKSSG